MFGQQSDRRHVDVRRIRLDAEFVAGRQRMPVQHDFQQPAQAIGVKMRGRAAAEVQRVNRPRMAQPA